MPKRKHSNHIEIKVLGEWSVKRDGEELTIGPNTEAILHALVMGRGKAPREQLEAVLPEPHRPRKAVNSAVRNALWDLRKEDKFDLTILKRNDPVWMPREQEGLNVDLWEFFKHVEFRDYKQAAELISGGRDPVHLVEGAHHNSFWEATMRAFRDAKKEVLDAIEAASGRHRKMLDVRSRLLDRMLVPGIGLQVPIRQVRAALESMPIPWRLLRPDEGLRHEPLPAYLRVMLADEQTPPRRLVVVGGHGAGKTLAAISAFLQLTDGLDQGKASLDVRPVLYVDGYTEGQEAGFATDSWFNKSLREAEAVGHGRPIVIMSHAEAFFARAGRSLPEILSWQMFRDSDVLLCCSESFYEEGLRYEDYGNCVVRLQPWDPGVQRSFGIAILGQDAWRAFEAWRNEDESGTRGQLSAIPLHLSYMLPLVEGDPKALGRISTRWHLFDQVARIRLRAAHQGSGEERRIKELAAIAHRFYAPEMPPDRPIGFNLDELDEFLRQRSNRNVKSRRERLIYDTLIAAPAPGSDEYHFEDPAWGWFFVATYLMQLLRGANPEQPVLRAFARRLSPEVIELFDEMLDEARSRYGEQIRDSLQSALDDAEVKLPKAQRAEAKRQIRRALSTVES